jgi:hypothetical protein
MERMAAEHRIDRFFGVMGFYLFLALGWGWWEMGNTGEEKARLLVYKCHLSHPT